MNNLVVFAVEQSLEEMGDLLLDLLRVCKCVDVGAVVFHEGALFVVLAEGVTSLLLLALFEVSHLLNRSLTDESLQLRYRLFFLKNQHNAVILFFLFIRLEFILPQHL